MGRAALILILGFTVSFGAIRQNVNKQALTATETYAADFDRVRARNAANGAPNIAIHQLSQNDSVPETSNVLTFQRPAQTVDVLSVDTTLVGRLIHLATRATVLGNERNTTQEVRVLIRKRSVMPPVPSAVFINAPATFNFDGNSFLVNGNDTNLNNSQGDCDPLPGVGLIDQGSRSSALWALAQNQRGNITGEGHSPSIAVLNDPPDLEEIVALLSKAAHRTYTGNTSVAGSTASSWGSVSNPQITVVDGSLTISGNGRGAGVLVVKGNVTMTGTFGWDGVVIVMGEVVSIRGTPDIWGCLMIQADAVFFEMKGNVGVRYSCEALQGNERLSLLGVPDIVSWWE